jgi:chemotaxis protein MotB
MAQVRGRLRGSFEPWPGYVDVLSTLLMVIIFVLLIFVIAQFFLSDALSGRDEELERLARQVSELTATLALERQTTDSLRTNVGDLSGELQVSVSSRDDLERRLKTAMDERSAMAASLAQSQAALAALQETQDALEARIAEGTDVITARDALNQRLTVIIGERDALATRLAETESTLADLRLAFAQKSDEASRLAAERDQLRQQLAELGVERDELAGQLGDTRTRLTATQSTLDATQSRLDETLSRASAAEADLGETRDTLAATLARLEEVLAQLETVQARLADTEIKLAAAERRLAETQSALDETQLRLNTATSRILSLQLAVADADASARGERDARTQVEASLEDAYKQIQADQAKVEALLQDIAVLESLRDELEATVLTTRERAEEDLAAERAVSEEARRQLELLNAQMLAARQRLADIQAALDLRESELQSRDATIQSQQIEITELGNKLNAALLSKVQELEKYRSEFFGRLREVLGDRQEVQVQGDRFIFQSEVLFESGSADLGPGGQVQLAQFAQTLNDIAATIPPEIDWLLRVDGHTDSRPIASPLFPSNWELSTARAIAVVKFLESQGIPANRLAATGFGEFRPISLGTDEDSLRRNRRIELKLDQQ